MAESSFQFDLDEALDQQPKVMLRDPFASISAPYFATEERNQQLALLEHLSRYSSMLFVVEGVKGSGKTAFMEEFARQQSDIAIISRVKGGMLMTAGQLLENIYKGFPEGVNGLTIDSSFGPLLKFAKDREQVGQSVLLLIDNAHELNTDAVTMLLDMIALANENQAVPHVVLFSEQPIQRNLDSYQKSRFDQLSHSQTLSPYSFEQTQAYLLHRVRSIGGEINLPFNERQLKTIFQESAGYPGAINQVARRLMGKGAEKSKFNLSLGLGLGFPLVHMALLSVVMLAILITVIFNDSESKSSTKTTGKVIPLTSNSQLSSNQNRTSSTIAKIEQVQRGLENNKAISLPPIPMDARVPPKSEPEKTTDTSIASTAKTLATQALTNTNVTTPKSAEPKVTQPSVLTTQGRSTSVVAAPIVSNTQPRVANNPVKQESAVASAQADRFDKTTWLLGQNPNRYTLQLLGTHTLSTVKDFIRDQGSLDGLSYFETVHNGREWFVVVYGLYRNRSQAIAGIEALPRDLRALTPWARGLRGIQQDIRKAQ